MRRSLGCLRSFNFDCYAGKPSGVWPCECRRRSSGKRHRYSTSFEPPRTQSSLSLHCNRWRLFRNDEDSAFVFRALPAPSRAEITAVAWQTCERVCELLRKRGLWLDADPSDDPFSAREPGLAACASTSIRGVLLLGERSGRRLLRLFGEAAYGEGQQETTSEVTVPGYGFNVHAQTRISGHDKKGRERLCRYISRPPLAQNRLEILSNGNVRLGFKRRWKDGTIAVVFEPLDLMSKLAALVPPPRMHRVRYHGVWSSHAKVRPKVTPVVVHPQGTDDCDTCCEKKTVATTQGATSGRACFVEFSTSTYRAVPSAALLECSASPSSPSRRPFVPFYAPSA